MPQEEFFLVDIIFLSGVKLLNVELSQSAIEWYMTNSPGTIIVPAGLPIPEDLPEEDIPEQPPGEEEEPEIIPEPTIPGDAITIVIPNATYGPSPTPGLGRIVLKIVSRLKDKTAMIKDPWLFIQVKDDITKTDVKLEQFQLKPAGIVFQQDFVFDVDTPSKRLAVLVTIFEAASFPISKGRRIILEFNAGTAPPPDPGEPGVTGSNFLPWVVVAAAGAAFISDKALSRRKRRR